MPLRRPRVLRAVILLLILAVAWGTRLGTRWPAIYYMTGPSMEPTVRARELFLTWSPPGSLARGDLVIFEFEDADGGPMSSVAWLAYQATRS